MRKTSFFVLSGGLLISLLTAAGCGGQNQTSNSFGGGAGGGLGAFGPNSQQNRSAQQANAEAASMTPVFLSDGSGSPNDHLWVKLYSVDVVTSTSTITIFSDPTGRTVDLKSLRQKDGPRFLYLGSIDPKAGDVVRAQVTLDKTYAVLKAGTTEVKSGTFSTPEVDTGKLKLTINLNPRLQKGEKPAIVLDVDLQKFDDKDDKNTKMSLKVGDTSGIEERQYQVPMEFTGLAGSIAGSVPALSFNVGFGENRFQRVITDSKTAIFSAEGQINPVLSDGNTLDVRGVFQYPERQFIAETIRVRDVASVPAPHEVIGVAQNFDTEKGTFEITPDSLNGFVAKASKFSVETSDKTVILGANGAKATKEDLQKALANTEHVEIEGAYDEQGNLLKAAWIKLAPKAGAPAGAAQKDSDLKPKENAMPSVLQGQPGTGAKIVSTPENPIPAPTTPVQPDGTIEGTAIIESFDEATGAFNLKNVEGLKEKAEAVQAAIDANTAFQNASGSLIGKSQFYKDLSPGKKIMFRGEIVGGKLILRRLLHAK